MLAYRFITGVMLPCLTAGVTTSMPQCDLEAFTKRLAVQLLEVGEASQAAANSLISSICCLSLLMISSKLSAVQTVGALHLKSKYAHLNITSSSIFVDQSAHPWDNVRLADFDYAQRGWTSTGKQHDVGRLACT